MLKHVLLLLSISVILFAACAAHAFGNPRADELRRSMGAAPDSTRAAILVSIARLYQYENLDSCIFYARRASDMAYRTRQYASLTESETLLSRIALERKRYDEATAHQRTVLEMTLRLRNWDMVMDSYNAIAQTWLLRNNYAEAVEYLKEGLKIAQERNSLEMSKYFSQALIDSYRKLRNVDAVCEYYGLLMETNSMIDAEAYNNRINALQNERETLVAEAEDARNMLRPQSFSKIVAIVWAILATAALVLAYLWFQYRFMPGVKQAQNDAKYKAYELDMIRRNQSVTFRFLSGHVQPGISSLAESAKNFEDRLPASTRSAFNSIGNDIHVLYEFFQNFAQLLQIQSGQSKPEQATVNVPQLVANLIAGYEEYATSKGITLINEVQNNTLAIADESLVHTVLCNVMSNAFKYAPRETGRITVGTKTGTKVAVEEHTVEDTGFIEVWITDDGIGLTPEQTEKLFYLSENLSLPGSEYAAKGYGAGLVVCKTAVEIMGGRIWAETKPGEGFCMRLCLPAASNMEVNTLLNIAENSLRKLETVSTEDLPDQRLLLPAGRKRIH